MKIQKTFSDSCLWKETSESSSDEIFGQMDEGIFEKDNQDGVSGWAEPRDDMALLGKRETCEATVDGIEGSGRPSDVKANPSNELQLIVVDYIPRRFTFHLGSCLPCPFLPFSSSR